MNRARLLLLACIVGTTAACGSDEPIVPNIPTPNIFTEVFSGTLNPGGGVTFPFISQSSGTVRATLTTVGPDPTSVVGILLGTVATGGACQVQIVNDQATQSSAITGLAGSAGNLCARVYDPGSSTRPITDPVSFDLTVEHP